MNWLEKHTTYYNCDHADQAHSIAEYWYKDRLLFTGNARDINKDEYKYTAAFNKDRTRASYFFTSKDIFFKWEAEAENPVLELIIYNALKGDHKILETAKYNPVEVKETQK